MQTRRPAHASSDMSIETHALVEQIMSEQHAKMATTRLVTASDMKHDQMATTMMSLVSNAVSVLMDELHDMGQAHRSETHETVH